MSKDTSGPAFPGQYDHGHTIESWTGMTLRDYFAAKAMHGFLMDDVLHKEASAAPEWLKSISDASYEMADAMLEAREAA